jgi:hypothetical protein
MTAFKDLDTLTARGDFVLAVERNTKELLKKLLNTSGLEVVSRRINKRTFL